jgi:hypothetical protein
MTAKMNLRRELRHGVLMHFGADEAFVNRLLEYNERSPRLPLNAQKLEFPLDDEPYVALWRRYAQEVELENSVECLSKYLVQFRFPLTSRMSAAKDYVAATRYGAGFERGASRPRCALPFVNPRAIRLWVHPTLAGSIPVWLASNREDFVTLLRALMYRNEPCEVGENIGAYIVSGFRNWHRYYSEPALNDANGFTDRFVILSAGPYSGVPAGAVNMTVPEWNETSVRIRLEHECTHYFTRRLFGSMANNIGDEILADYRGIVSAYGAYRADWALRFLGIRSDGGAGPGGRLDRYVSVGFPESARACLRRLAARSVANLATLDAEMPWTRDRDAAPFVIWSVATLSLEELASDCGVQLINENLQRLICARNGLANCAAVS